MDGLLNHPDASALRDWATLVFAFLAAAFAWQARSLVRRRRRVYMHGHSQWIGEKTLEVSLHLRNQTPEDVYLHLIALKRPSPAVLAIDGIYDPGPGPIPCNHLVPAFQAGVIKVLIGFPAGLAQPLRIQIRHKSVSAWFGQSKLITVDPAARLLSPPD